MEAIVAECALSKAKKAAELFYLASDANNAMKTAETAASNISPASIRSSNVAGMPGIGPTGFLGGTGGSSTPTPMNFRGGIVECPEEGCGSGTGSHSVNSYGMYRSRLVNIA
jgi:hypothetical protein